MNLDQSADTITPSSGTLNIAGAILPTTALAVGGGGTCVATLSGLAFGNATSAFTAATAAQVVSVIGTTAVTNATNATTATNATNVAVANASTNANYYPTFVAATGSNQSLKTASSTLKYNPSTGALSTGSIIYIAP